VVPRNLIGCRSHFKEEIFDGLRPSREDRVTVGLAFAVRNVALASAVATMLLNRI